MTKPLTSHQHRFGRVWVERQKSGTDSVICHTAIISDNSVSYLYQIHRFELHAVDTYFRAHRRSYLVSLASLPRLSLCPSPKPFYIAANL